MQINFPLSAGGVMIATFAPVIIPLVLLLVLIGVFAYLKAGNKLSTMRWLPIALSILFVGSIIFFALHLDHSTYLHYIR